MFRRAWLVDAVRVAGHAVILNLVFAATAALANEYVVFGPQTYTRATGTPVTVTNTFRVNHPTPPSTLRVTNHGITSAEIQVNGHEIFGPSDIKDDTTTLERAVTLLDGANQISVQLRSAPGASLTIDIVSTDNTPPTISGAIAPPPNASGWNNTNATVTFSCADTQSGVASCQAPATVAAEGANQDVVGTATDVAGNTATTSVTVNLDRTPPDVTAAQVPPPNANGWNNSPVVVTFTATDALSGVALGSITAPVTLAADGRNLSASGRAVDLAGNVGTFTLTGVNIDQVAPIITATLGSSPNANGWFNAPVTVHFTCTDAGSGVDLCPPDQVVSTEGTQTVSGTAADRAGNRAATTTGPIRLDITPPSITVTLTPPPNTNGWNNAPVTAHFTCTDSGSGVANCPPDQIFAADGAGFTASGTATDLAGNSASITSAAINIDTAAPAALVTLSPSPNPNGWYTGPVTAHFTCVDALSGIDTCPPDRIITTEGVSTVAGTAIDKAGNTISVTGDPIRIDLGPPTITATLAPAPNANGWNNTPVTVHFTCADSGSGVATCPPDQTVATDGAGQSVTGIAVDMAGNSAVVFADVNVDRVAPRLTLTSPADGAKLLVSRVSTTGTVTDDLSGLASVTCNGALASTFGGTLGCDVSLTRGANTIAVVATDLAGNTSAASIGVSYAPVPSVRITAPDNASYLNITPTTVTGIVDDPNAVVTVNSIPAPNSNGAFSAVLPLAEGPNLVTAAATTAEGAIGTASVTITLDTTPPHVTITSPSDQFITTESSISVAGNVNDLVVGTVNDQQAKVTVNGATAQVANRTFLAADVPLLIGPNTIQAVATDRVGNAATMQITIVRRAIANAQIRLVSGNNQSGAIGSQLAAPLVVALTDAAGNAVANRPVVFKVTQNDGTLVTLGASPNSSALASTDAQGHATAQWTLGHRAGAGGKDRKSVV